MARAPFLRFVRFPVREEVGSAEQSGWTCALRRARVTAELLNVPEVNVQHGTVVVTEACFISEDLCYLSGRFSATWCPDGAAEPVEDGPQAVDVESAIAWGRARAPVVVVALGDGEKRYSAGSRQPVGPPLPEWPRGGIAAIRHPVA